MTVALIGLMAAGKSTVGRALAERLKLPFVDTDAVIEAATGRTVRELWEAGGESAYRPRERDAVAATLAAGSAVVLAVPGGVAVDDDMATRVTGSGALVVYLRAAPETLTARVTATGGDAGHRPLLGADPARALAELHRRRDGRYAALADLVVDVDGRSAAAVVDRILAALSSH